MTTSLTYAVLKEGRKDNHKTKKYKTKQRKKTKKTTSAQSLFLSKAQLACSIPKTIGGASESAIPAHNTRVAGEGHTRHIRKCNDR